MRRRSIDIIDGTGVTDHYLIKQLDDIGLAFFSQIVLEKHVFGAGDHVLRDPFPAIVSERDPINLRLSVSLPERICSRFPDKDEIALFGSQHHIIPVDDKHMAGGIAY